MVVFLRHDILFAGFPRAEAQRLQKEAKLVGSSGAMEIVQEQRPALKFGFGSKPVASKVVVFYYLNIFFSSSCLCEILVRANTSNSCFTSVSEHLKVDGAKHQTNVLTVEAGSL